MESARTDIDLRSIGTASFGVPRDRLIGRSLLGSGVRMGRD